MRDRKELDSDGRGGREGLGRVERGRTITRIHYVRGKSIFNKREKKLRLRSLRLVLGA